MRAPAGTAAAVGPDVAVSFSRSREAAVQGWKLLRGRVCQRGDHGPRLPPLGGHRLAPRDPGDLLTPFSQTISLLGAEGTCSCELGAPVSLRGLVAARASRGRGAGVLPTVAPGAASRPTDAPPQILRGKRGDQFAVREGSALTSAITAHRGSRGWALQEPRGQVRIRRVLCPLVNHGLL